MTHPPLSTDDVIALARKQDARGKRRICQFTLGRMLGAVGIAGVSAAVIPAVATYSAHYQDESPLLTIFAAITIWGAALGTLFGGWQGGLLGAIIGVAVSIIVIGVLIAIAIVVVYG